MTLEVRTRPLHHAAALARKQNRRLTPDSLEASTKDTEEFRGTKSCKHAQREHHLHAGCLLEEGNPTNLAGASTAAPASWGASDSERQPQTGGPVTQVCRR